MRLFLFTAITTLLIWGSAYAQGQSLSNIKVLDDVEPAVGSAPPIETAYPDLYKALNDKLGNINQELTNYDLSSAIPQLSFQKSVIKEGDLDPNMPLLRARMSEFLPTEAFDTDPYLYDQFLSEAVKAYQIKHALKSDGIIGPQTLAFMNRSLLDKKKQIEINLFRLQQAEWQSRPPLRIDVDVARYSLTAYEEGEIAFEMPVVVGSKARQTNIFSTIMTGVRINPGWTLPPTIKAEDYIPKLRTTPEWVTQQGVMIYAGWERDAQPIDPTTVDWNFLSDNDIKAMRFYKNAGDENPLGRYRFLMNNQYDIYLHDTNQKYLFNRSARAYSSGCVRVYDPRKITEFLLKDNPDWTSDKIDAVLEKGETYNIQANRSIPVYFDYKTAWLNNDGDLILGHDIYGMDETVYNQMQDSQKTLEDY